MKKDRINQFLNRKSVKCLLGENFDKEKLSKIQQSSLISYFQKNGYKDSEDNFTRLARWILLGVDNFIKKEQELLSYQRMSEEYFILLYGDKKGRDRWNNTKKKARSNLPTTLEYWQNKGYNENEGREKIIEHQKNASSMSAKNRNHRQYSIRCKEYWIDKGYDEDTAQNLVSDTQRRDLPYYIEKYGDISGRKKHRYAIQKRIRTWENKSSEERKHHYLKTLSNRYNPDGQEMQAVRLFLKQNNIDAKKCMYGPPNKQFYQWIPEVGFRRYDLAVFEEKEKKTLSIIMEFHGPGHINFSDYSTKIQNKIIEANDGTKLPHLGTYGDAYKNDYEKRKHILNNYPNVKYCVYWIDDLKNKNMEIK